MSLGYRRHISPLFTKLWTWKIQFSALAGPCKPKAVQRGIFATHLVDLRVDSFLGMFGMKAEVHTFRLGFVLARAVLVSVGCSADVRRPQSRSEPEN